jgi:hypothetical protein
MRVDIEALSPKARTQEPHVWQHRHTRREACGCGHGRGAVAPAIPRLRLRRRRDSRKAGASRSAAHVPIGHANWRPFIVIAGVTGFAFLSTRRLLAL